MARNVIERELTRRMDRCRFAVATRNDDADIRRLLRENPMPGTISISLERQPDYFADADSLNEDKQTIVARDQGRLACVGNCTIRERHVNGKPARVGYLGGLRLAASHAGQFEILRAGYEFFHQLQMDAPAEFYFTSIASDNYRARRILERNLPGMPRYEFVSEFVTVLLAAKPKPWREQVKHSFLPSFDCVAAQLNKFNREFQFAPVWSAAELDALQTLGLEPDHFTTQGDAMAAIWDQRRFKQTVIRGYSPAIKRIRPVINVLTRLTGGQKLPAIGDALSNAFVSHLIAEPDRPDALVVLVEKLRNVAASRGIETLAMGFSAEDSRLATLRQRFRLREYHSRIYAVHWPGCGGTAAELDGRLPAPEVALL
jgi:hypothetical protein